MPRPPILQNTLRIAREVLHVRAPALESLRAAFRPLAAASAEADVVEHDGRVREILRQLRELGKLVVQDGGVERQPARPEVPIRRAERRDS